MPISIKTIGCNGLCRRCYENRIRSVHSDTSYDIDAILKTLEEETSKTPKNLRYSHACLHGGEPLMMKFEDVEKLVIKIHGLYGSGNIQTNGTLITPQLIELFKEYRFSVGVSIDGDTWELNYGRWNAAYLPEGDIQKETDKVLDNMRLCRDAGLDLSVITLLSKYNASKERLPAFIKFLLRLRDEFGVCWVRINEALISEEENRDEEELTNEEMGYAYCQLADVCFSDPVLAWLPFREVVDLMLGYTRNATCIFTQCDVWATNSERTIMGDGSIGGCLKGGAAIDGIQALAAEGLGDARYRMLFQTPQEQKGCKDCRYWSICNGGCPGAGIDNDWRNRTRKCEAWKQLFSHVEEKIKGLMPNVHPLPTFYPCFPSSSLVQASLGEDGSSWAQNKRKNLEELKQQCLESPTRDACGYGDRPHGDKLHGDKPYGDKPHGDKPYGDRPHGDSGHTHVLHGDSSYKDKPYGDKPHGDESSRDKLHGDKPYGDKPYGDESSRDKLHGDKPYGDESSRDKLHGDKPYGDKPHGDKPYGDRPHGDM